MLLQRQIPLIIIIVIINFQGLFYEKDSEGAMYVASNGAVQPGETVWYKWTVPADFAPAEGDPSCINQAYYSAIDPAKDTNSGLIGLLVSFWILTSSQPHRVT